VAADRLRAGARHAVPDDCAVGAALGRSPLSHDNHQAIILFGHGARDARWREPFDRLHARLSALRPDCAVRLAFSN
jgi:hypothetical protein